MLTSSAPDDTYEALLAMFDAEGVPYQLIDHDPEGTTEVVSALRGHPVEQAAKCLLLMVKTDRRTRRHVLAVVAGDRRVDLDAVRALYGARYVGFSDAGTATELARAVPGTVLPFPIAHDDAEVDLLVDPGVIAQPRLYFNAARLDRSVSIAGADYERLARAAGARVEPIAG